MFLPSNITLKLGDSGDFVTELQRRLAIVKCFHENAINGFFDGATVNGVSSFQSMSGLRADGIAGPETLRRLNGSLSGDTSSSAPDTKAEEEAQQLAAAQLQQQIYLAEQQPEMQSYAHEAAVEQSVSYQPEPQHHQPQSQVVEQATAAQQHTVQQQLQRELEMQARAQTGPSASDVLAQMLLSQTQQPAPQPAQAPQPLSAIDQAMQAAAAAGQMQQVHAPQHQHAPAAAAPAAAPEPRGIVGRTMQFANEMMQKLATYFEAKLPAHVLQEVKEIGHTMAKSGIKEAAIPTGPDQIRGADTPARGPQQQQTAQLPQRP
ncbi:MAG: peptidoglycan-binding domain-containing protein [Pseudomonadota bacterium]